MQFKGIFRRKIHCQFHRETFILFHCTRKRHPDLWPYVTTITRGKNWLITHLHIWHFSILSRRVSRAVLQQIHSGSSSKIHSKVFNWLKNDNNNNRPPLSKTCVILYLKSQGEMFEMQQFFIRQLWSVSNLYSQYFFLWH